MKKFWRVQMLWALVMAVACAGCMDIKDVDDKKEEGAGSVQLRAVKSGDPVVVPLAEPHAYQVLFASSSQDGAVVVDRNLVGTKGQADAPAKQHLTLPVINGQAVDRDVREGETYVYSFGPSAGGIQDRRKVTIPRDFVIDGEMTPETPLLAPLFAADVAKQSFGRLVFLPGSVLTTEGMDLTWNFVSLQAEHATLRTFEPGAEAPPVLKNPFASAGTFTPANIESAEMRRLVNGKSGGNLILHARKAVGSLLIELHGQHGTRGLEAPPPDAQLKGASGANADITDLLVMSHAMNSIGHFHTPSCPLNRPGGAGGTGKPGYEGGRGGDGGDSGRLELQIADAKDFTPEIRKSPGVGGDGGPGGEGGEGGNGGNQPGEIPSGFIGGRDGFCAGPTGAKGAKGPVGPKGKPGSPGHESEVCILRGDKPDCRN